MSKFYIVTGGAGYIGSLLCKTLLDHGYKVLSLDKIECNSYFFGKKNYKNLIFDLSCESLLELNEFVNVEIDGVFHLAACKSVSESTSNPSKYLLNNVNATENVSEFCKTQKNTKLVFSSSAAVYSAPLDFEKITETHKTSPLNYYGETKVLGEEIIREYGYSSKNQAISMRLFNVIGCHPFFENHTDPLNVSDIILQKMLQNETFTLYGENFDTKDGSSVRDYIDVRDVVRSLLGAMNYRAEGGHDGEKIFNVSNGLGATTLDLIELFERVFSKGLKVETQPARKGEIPFIVGDNSLIKSQLGWSPKYSLHESVTSYLK